MKIATLYVERGKIASIMINRNGQMDRLNNTNHTRVSLIHIGMKYHQM